LLLLAMLWLALQHAAGRQQLQYYMVILPHCSAAVGVAAPSSYQRLHQLQLCLHLLLLLLQVVPPHAATLLPLHLLQASCHSSFGCCLAAKETGRTAQTAW
jgi:hypothetical protein